MSIDGLELKHRDDLAIPSFENYIERARIGETVVDVGAIATKIKQHEMSKGALPDARAVAPSDAVLRAVNELFGRRVAEWVH